MIAALALALQVAAAPLGPVQAADIRGTVRDSASGEPIVGATVEAWTTAQRRGFAMTDAGGTFRLAGLPPGTYLLRLLRVGYRPTEAQSVATGATGLVLTMTAIAVPLAPVVVSVERAEQSTLEAPASISVVTREDVAEQTTLTAVEHVRATTGVDFAAKGLTSATFAVRGSRSSQSTVLMVLTDYRYAAVPSLRVNVPYLIPTTDDDVERIEVLRGASAALYGPDSDRGVLHVITRSPFDSRGGSLTLTGGERELFGVSARYAGRLGGTLAAKFSVNYLRGRDWPNRDTLETVRRDPFTERLTAEARLDWRPSPRTELVTSAGVAEAIRNVDITDPGPFQVRNWRYTYLQGRLRHRDLFANLVVDLSDAGRTFSLRNGIPVVDESRLVAGQVQHRASLGRTRLVYGFDSRLIDPRTRGTINGRFENDDQVREVGGYLSATTPLSPRVDLVTAARIDHHDVIGDVAVSPRLGLVYTPRQEHALRLTYNRAFSTPATTVLFIDLLQVQQLCAGGLCVPFAVRASGTPRGGYSFRRDCGGLCMRSPFAGAGQFVPTDATLAWDTLVAYAAQFGVDLSSVPTPTSADVASDLRMLNPYSQSYDPALDPDDVRDLSPNTREITDAIEVGYKGLLGERLFVGVDLYYTRVSDVMGSIQTGTPNVFFNQASLEAYLAQYLPADSAALIAAVASQVPVGTVSPQESPYPTDILIVTPQGGSYDFWGLDLDVQSRLGEHLSLSANYSWTSRDRVNETGALAAYALGSPRHKGSVRAEWRDEARGLSASARGRAVNAFPVRAGVWRGTVDAYLVLDLAAGFRLPWRRDIRFSVTAFNVLNSRHREYVGAPQLGRLVVGRLQTRF
jgi:iron complex outermembrane receptor protein